LTNKKNPSLAVNALSNWITLAVTVIIGFLITPFIIEKIGTTGYGIWILISSIIGYYGILDLGITSAITRYIALYAKQKNYKGLNETISTSLTVFIVIGLVVIIISFFVAKPLAIFFNISTNYAKNFQQLLILLGISIGFGFPGKLFGAVVRAHERFVLANSISVIITLVRSSLIVVFLSRDFGLTGIAFSYLISTCLDFIFNYFMCKFKFSNIRIRLKSAKWLTAGMLLSFGSATTLASIADIMRSYLDSFVIGKWVSIKAVAVYGIAAILIRFFLQFIAQGTKAVLTPRFSSLEGEGKRDQIHQLFLKSLSIASYLSFAAGTLIIIFGKQFIVLWVGTDFIGAVPVLWVLTLSYSIAFAQDPGISLVYALKKHYFFAAASIIEGIVNVVLSIYLAPRYGILGVAIGTAVPMLLIKLFLQPIYVSRIVGISFVRYWGKLMPTLVLAAGLIMIAPNMPKIELLGNGYISLAVNGVLFLVPFALLYVLTDVILRYRIVLMRNKGNILVLTIRKGGFKKDLTE